MIKKTKNYKKIVRKLAKFIHNEEIIEGLNIDRKFNQFSKVSHARGVGPVLALIDPDVTTATVD